MKKPGNPRRHNKQSTLIEIRDAELDTQQCGPDIHIWRRSPQEYPQEAATMQLFLDNKDWLAKVLQQNGIARADITPLLPHGSYDPRDGTDTQYEMFTHPGVSYSQTMKVEIAIESRFKKLRGYVRLSFRTEADFQMHVSFYGLQEME